MLRRLVFSRKTLAAILPLALLGGPLAAQTVTTTVSIGPSAGNVAVNPVTNKIYVANPSNSSLSVVDGASNAVSSLAVGANPGPIAVNTLTNKIYVANTSDATVTVVDGATGVSTTVSVGTNPAGIAVNPVSNKIYVVNEGSPPCYTGSVTVIDGSTNGTTEISAGSFPQTIAVDPVSNRIYVGGNNGVTMIDGTSNTPSILAAGTAAQSVAANPATNKIYSTNFAANTMTVIDGQTHTTSSVNVGANPQAIAVNPATNKIYVANYLDGTVSVVDGSTQTAITVAVGFGPEAITLDPLSNRIYVANAGSNSITIIDGATNTATSIGVGAAPTDLVVNPVTRRIYVSNAGNSTLTVLDAATNTVSSVAVGTDPVASAVNPVTDKVYIANFSSNSVTVFDRVANTTTSVAVGNAPVAIAANSLTNKIYVANYASQSVTVIDGTMNSPTSLAMGKGPKAIDLNPVTNKIYVSNETDNTVSVIDGATNNTTVVPVGTAPGAIAVNQATDLIYVLNNGNNSVTVIDGTTNNTVSFSVGANPTGIAVNSLTNKVYVTNSNGLSVTVIDGATNTTATVPAGDTPIAVAVNPITNKIYVANNGSNDVTIIDGAMNQTTRVAVGAAPVAIAVSQATNKVYVANQNSANITVIDGPALAITTVPVGSRPAGLSVNPFTNQLYVVNSGSNTISVLREEPVNQMPLAASVTPLPGDVANTAAPQFTFTVADSIPGGTVDNLLFQVDTWQGPWAHAMSQGAGNFTGGTVSLQPGLHYLYAYSTDGQDAMSANPGHGSSILLSNIAAYRFVIQSPLQIVPLDLNFGQQAVGTSSPSQVTTLTNGGAPLSISYVSVLGPFSETTTCGSSLGSGARCTISVTFSPTTTGTAQGALIISDSAPGAGQVIPLLGIGIGLPSTTALSISANPITFGQPVTLTANVATSKGTPTGTATFLDGGVSLAVATLNASGSAQFTVPKLSAGTHSITATYSGDATFSPSSSNGLNETVLNVVVLNMVAAGSPVVFNSLADDAVSNPAICGTNHWTKSLGGLMHDNRNGLHGVAINDETADVWVTWDGSQDGTTSSNGCVFLAVDSVVAVRGYMAVPRASLAIIARFSGTSGDSLLPWLGSDSPLPESLFNAINGSTVAPFPGTPPNIVFSELRPEDAQYATARTLSKLSPNRSGLGYGDWPNPTTFGSSVVGASIVSSYSSSLSEPSDFEVAPLGFDPISGSSIVRWTTYPVGVVPLLIIASNEDDSPTGLGQGLSPGLAGPGPWTAGPYAASTLTPFAAAYLFDGSLTRTIDLLPDGVSLAQSCSGTSCGLTQLQRETLSGAFNTFEYDVTRSHFAQSSQEDGVVPGSTNMNPLNIVVPSGGTRLRVMGTAEMVNAVCGSSCLTPPAGVVPTKNRLGYTFWTYNNLKPLAGVHGGGTGTTYNTAPPKGHYFLFDNIDPLFAQAGDNPDGALNPPSCLQVPCPKIPFTHLIDGTYPIWAVVRAVTASSHYRGDGTPIDGLLSSLPTSATKFSDYLTIDQMHVFRSHRDANVAGLDARNGNGCPFDYGNDIGQEMGGAIFTIQSDLDYAFDSGGGSNTCLGTSPPDAGLVNTVQ